MSDNNDNDAIDKIRKLLEGLTAQEAKVLRERFGINLDRINSLEEVKKQFDVTRERIRRIEQKALKQLRYTAISSRLNAVIPIATGTWSGEIIYHEEPDEIRQKFSTCEIEIKDELDSLLIDGRINTLHSSQSYSFLIKIPEFTKDSIVYSWQFDDRDHWQLKGRLIAFEDTYLILGKNAKQLITLYGSLESGDETTIIFKGAQLIEDAIHLSWTAKLFLHDPSKVIGIRKSADKSA